MADHDDIGMVDSLRSTVPVVCTCVTCICRAFWVVINNLNITSLALDRWCFACNLQFTLSVHQLLECSGIQPFSCQHSSSRESLSAASIYGMIHSLHMMHITVAYVRLCSLILTQLGNPMLPGYWAVLSFPLSVTALEPIHVDSQLCLHP